MFGMHKTVLRMESGVWREVWRDERACNRMETMSVLVVTANQEGVKFWTRRRQVRVVGVRSHFGRG
jgi:hypothetical protein